MFVFGPSLLLEGTPGTVIWASVSAIIGVAALAAGVERWFIGRPASWLQTALLLIAALLLIKPGLTTDLVGFGLLALVAIMWYLEKNKPPVAIPGGKDR
jgi:TRAP-type uncharacterized transport system fused permease subunit